MKESVGWDFEIDLVKLAVGDVLEVSVKVAVGDTVRDSLGYEYVRVPVRREMVRSIVSE